MTKKAVLALLIAIAIPVFGYFLLNYLSNKNIKMPNRYFYDSVMVKTEHGRTTFDTLWHKVNNIEFTNQLGKKVSLDDLKGKIIVMDFFFSRCPSICPEMTRNMKKLQSAFAPSDTLIHFISVSVDPEHDDVSRLNWWAQKFDVNPDNWWLVTGDKETIYDFALKEMKASVADVQVDTGFIHTENFFVMDRQRIIRGWYNGLDSDAQDRILKDLPLLILEKDNKQSLFRRATKVYKIPQ